MTAVINALAHQNHATMLKNTERRKGQPAIGFVPNLSNTVGTENKSVRYGPIVRKVEASADNGESPRSHRKLQYTTMRYFKKAWSVWFDMMSLDWLDRLKVQSPLLGNAVTACIVSIAMALFASLSLDPNVRIHSRVGTTKEPFRELPGIVLALIAFSSAVLSVYFYFQYARAKRK